MTGISHHIPEPLLASYAAGSLPHPFAVVIATHVSQCDTCRAGLSAHEAVGGLVLEDQGAQPVSPDLRDSILDLLDAPATPEPTPPQRNGIYPGPVMAALKGKEPRWKSLGLGVKQSILHDASDGSVRLLYIPPGCAVPDHGHNGLELTLVLQGSFSDETGQFNVGDLEVADDDLEHTPTADPGQACICLAATDAPLRFRSFVPRMLQPLFRI
jgi:putative transcriptional regulator